MGKHSINVAFCIDIDIKNIFVAQTVLWSLGRYFKWSIKTVYVSAVGLQVPGVKYKSFFFHHPTAAWLNFALKTRSAISLRIHGYTVQYVCFFMMAKMFTLMIREHRFQPQNDVVSYVAKSIMSWHLDVSQCMYEVIISLAEGYCWYNPASCASLLWYKSSVPGYLHYFRRMLMTGPK